MATKEKLNLHKEVADQLISALTDAIENGSSLPWRKPWASLGAPRNINGNIYKGMNIFLLSIKAQVMGWTDLRFGTYNQIGTLGGNVKKGEKGTRVVLWKFIKDKKDPEGKKTFPLLRFFTVFNIKAQTEGIELPEVVAPNKDERRPEIEEILGAVCPTKFGGDRAFYSPSDDEITLPVFEHFKNCDAFLATWAHEAAHATGHESRLDRNLDGFFGSESYAAEELVAEMTSAMVATSLGFNTDETMQNNVSYLRSWIKTLKDNPNAAMRAASLANTAAKHILGDHISEDNVEEEEATA
jgi:antirestriction protein ArdC